MAWIVSQIHRLTYVVRDRFLKKEDGGFLLKEDGGRIIVE